MGGRIHSVQRHGVETEFRLLAPDLGRSSSASADKHKESSHQNDGEATGDRSDWKDGERWSKTWDAAQSN